MKRILIALDDSDVSANAARFVEEFFRDMPLEVLAVNVARRRVPWVDPMWGYGYVGAWAYPYPVTSDDPTVQEVEEHEKAEGREMIERTGLEPDGTIVEVGDPVSVIIGAAVTNDVDLIVVGAHDKGFLQRLFSGSVSQDVVRIAPTPVLVVGEHSSEPSAARS
jgi:nucleotide-binding universal stress UspA family protein